MKELLRNLGTALIVLSIPIALMIFWIWVTLEIDRALQGL